VAPDTGVLSVAPGAHFDAASEPQLTLDVFARNECTPTRVTVSVSSQETAPPPVVPDRELTFSVEVSVSGHIPALLAQWIQKLFGG
jgi:hypothetical protein